MPGLSKKQTEALDKIFWDLKIWIDRLPTNTVIEPEDNFLVCTIGSLIETGNPAPIISRSVIEYEEEEMTILPTLEEEPILNGTTEKKEGILYLLSKQTNDEKITLLSTTIKKGRQELFEYLLPESILDQRDAFGYTPFTLACKYGRFEMAKMLLEIKPEFLDIACTKGNYPIVYAADSNAFDIVEHILKIKPQQINCCAILENEALAHIIDYAIIAKKNKKISDERFLDIVARSNDINHQIEFFGTKDTPIIACLKIRAIDAAHILLNKEGIDLTLCDNKGMDPLYVATKNSVRFEEFKGFVSELTEKLSKTTNLASEARAESLVPKVRKL